ncbi:lytic transglycosylase [Bifidobacterium ramosum]|nr:lytic transglycosylase [Bifidobacterium ramosum]
MPLRRWTPQRLVMLRRIRVAASAIIVTAAAVGMFLLTARKTVAITVNGETTTVTTYAMSAQRLLASQGITIKTHDLVESSAGGDKLTDRAVVTVQSAYQTTITIDGQRVPFWTTATSAAQLLGFFEQNEAAAAKVTVDIDNVYNKLTGGLVINEDGPVTVIADGKTTEAPNGKLPAASILDAAGITVGKDDRVSVEHSDGKTILRVQRVTTKRETRTVTVPHGTQTIVDPTLQPGESEIRQEGEDGETLQTYDVTYVDGVKESETLVSETTKKIAVDTIVAVGPAQDTVNDNDSDATGDGSTADDTNGSANDTTGSTGTQSTTDGGGSSQTGTNDTDTGSGNGNTGGSTSANDGNSNSNTGNSTSGSGNTGGDTSSGTTDRTPNGGNSTDSGSDNSSGNTNSNGDGSNSSNGNTNSGNGNSNSSGNTSSGNSNSSGNTSSGNSSDSGNTNNSGNGNSNTGSGSDSGTDTDSSTTARLWHPTAAQAQTYAAGAAAQRGWTGDEWTALLKLWTRESGWQWNAENAWSHAYGIPQALPGDKMATFGTDWKNDAAVQIDWGLYYIAQRYGTPSKAWQHSETVGWY